MKITKYLSCERVKRDRNKLSVPLTTEDWDWNFDNIKELMGQGKLYCRLPVRLSSILSDYNDDIFNTSPFAKSDHSPDTPSCSNQSTSVATDNNSNAGESVRIKELESLVYDLVEKQSDEKMKFEK